MNYETLLHKLLNVHFHSFISALKIKWNEFDFSDSLL